MTIDVDPRRRSLLASLAFAPAGAATAREMVREMRRTHNMPVSGDLVRGDFSWLAEQGLVLLRDDAAMVTERGLDVVQGAAPWPGH